MQHEQRVFQFADNEGNPVELKSKKYNFKIEEVLINRFGKAVLDDYSKSHNLNFNLTLDHVKEDFPKLLDDIPNDFDFSEPDYDSILEVYFFFINYKENALLRQVQFKKEMLALLNQALEENLDSVQKNLSSMQSSTNMQSIS